MNHTVDTHFLLAAILIISSALVFYTIGVWGERVEKELKGWHILFFCFGLIFDMTGTAIMAHIAALTGVHDNLHAVMGGIAVSLMFLHVVYAVRTWKWGTTLQKEHFNRYSIFVWCFWLIPYTIGAYLGMHGGA